MKTVERYSVESLFKRVKSNSIDAPFLSVIQFQIYLRIKSRSCNDWMILLIIRCDASHQLVLCVCVCVCVGHSGIKSRTSFEHFVNMNLLWYYIPLWSVLPTNNTMLQGGFQPKIDVLDMILWNVWKVWWEYFTTGPCNSLNCLHVHSGNLSSWPTHIAM